MEDDFYCTIVSISGHEIGNIRSVNEHVYVPSLLSEWKQQWITKWIVRTMSLSDALKAIAPRV